MEILSKKMFTNTTGITFYDDFITADADELEHYELDLNLDGGYYLITPSLYWETCRTELNIEPGSKLVPLPDFPSPDLRHTIPLLDLTINRNAYDDYFKYSTSIAYAIGEKYGWDCEFPVYIIESQSLTLRGLEDERWKLIPLKKREEFLLEQT